MRASMFYVCLFESHYDIIKGIVIIFKKGGYMKTQQYLYEKGKSLDMPIFEEWVLKQAQLVFIISNSWVIKNTQVFENTKALYLNADIIFSSASGAIYGDSLYDEDVIVTALFFEKTPLKIHTETITERKQSFQAGVNWVLALKGEDLKHIFVLTEGNLVNGDQLTKWSTSVMPTWVAMSEKN